MKRLCFVLALCAATAGAVHAATKLTYVDLVRRLMDLEALAALPVEGEQCMQWSSYDRASRYDAETGKYVAWEANNDGYDIIRAEGDFQVLAEIEGPGCIRRIWSAMAESGHVRIYLDGSPEPTVDLPFSGYFDCKNEPFIYPSLIYISSRGNNCYVPIPFQKSCKIVADKGWGRYYHFTYTKFPKGTIVPTFKRELRPLDRGSKEGCGESPHRRLRKSGRAPQAQPVLRVLGPGNGVMERFRLPLEIAPPPAPLIPPC